MISNKHLKVVKDEHKQIEVDVHRSQKELSLISSKLLTVQENDKKRIACELHDVIGQYLTAIKYSVENALIQIDKNNVKSSVKSLKTVIPIVQEATEEVRKIIMGLHPSTLDNLGIIATISCFCREIQRIYSRISIEKQIELQESEVPSPLKVVFYRVLQETLSNIVKHSKADFVCISIRKLDNKIELSVKDNGVGFRLEEAFSVENSTKGVGLTSMKDRIIHSGGTFSVCSTRGKGTIVSASWPCVN